MKTNRFATVLTVAALAASALVFSGCEQAASSAASASYSGSARYTFPVHQSGVVAEAVVTTDANGNVASATFNEWQSPSSWVYGTGSAGALAGGELVRIKMAGKNSAIHILNGAGTDMTAGYVFFYYNAAAKGWVEYTPSSGATVPTVASATAAAGNWDLKLANPLYGLAYADAAAAAATASNNDLTTVVFDATTVTAGTISGTSTLELNATGNAAAQAALKSVVKLNKADAASAYFPITSTNLGYQTNHDRFVAFFKKNPTANYAAATQSNVTWADYTKFTAPSATYTQTTDSVWSVGTGTDAVTGATCSDFPAYTLALQTAYLEALAEAKAGNLRSAN